MPQSKPDPAMIAKGLTWAERFTLKHIVCSRRRYVFPFMSFELTDNEREGGRRLVARGLARNAFGFWTPTPLGLAVRDRSENDG
jgi:hypothetical protein